jgi:hypothetical protein
MAENFIDTLLNFIIPPAIFLFIFWILYKIPIVNEGIASLIDWNRRRVEGKVEREETSTLKSITYE